eukprot:TRINITY_DN2423_c0_g3_i1.p1 TRINITY_DN2423_c0_g3~~TRINITY_DN2423_c0_g3_i1.p1  ORF type:complete len:107 (+),score=13.41 TRINITY_DN2423_c0_g3_i1:74-394(+)
MAKIFESDQDKFKEWLDDNNIYYPLNNSLEIFDIKGKRIDLIPHTIRCLQNIHTIKCQKNNLTSLPESIGDLIQLKIFLCEENKLTTLPETILELSCLEKLHCYQK